MTPPHDSCPDGRGAFPGMKLLPAGPHAILLDLPDQNTVRRYYAEAERRRAAGQLPGEVRDVIPAARTILFDGISDPTGLSRDIHTWAPATPDPRAQRRVEVPVTYTGPDLEDVARLWGMTQAEVVNTHASSTHEVAFLGFAPGFAYITGIGESRSVPRRPHPRTSVPAGSVALAAEFTGIYPRSSPGGWQLIGHTDLTLWDPDQEPASTLTPGTLVTFSPVTP